MVWTLLGFWAFLLCEPGLTAAIPVATEWPATGAGFFTPIDYDLSWWTSSDYFDPTTTTEQVPTTQSAASPPRGGLSEANPASASELDSSGLVGNETLASRLASNESHVDSATRGPGKLETIPPEGPTGPQQEMLPSFSDGSSEAAAPSLIPGVFVSNPAQPSAGAAGEREDGAAAAKWTPLLGPSEPGEPATVLLPLFPSNKLDPVAEPGLAAGRGDADSAVLVTVSSSDQTATVSPPSEDAGLSPESTAEVPPGGRPNLEGGDALASLPEDGTRDMSAGSFSLGSDATLASSNTQSGLGAATGEEELEGSADLIGEEAPSAATFTMEPKLVTEGTYVAGGPGSEVASPFGEKMAGTTLAVHSNQDEVTLLPSEAPLGAENARPTAAVITDAGSVDFPPLTADAGTLTESDKPSGEASLSTPLDRPPPESFSSGGQAGEASSGPYLGSSPDVGVGAGDSWDGSGSTELDAGEAGMAAGSDSPAGTAAPSSDTVSGLPEKGKTLEAWTDGEIASQASGEVGEAIPASQALRENPPSASTSPVEGGEAFTANGVSGVESPSASSVRGAQSAPLSGAQPTVPSGIPVSNQPPPSNVLTPGSLASKKAQGSAGPLNIIWKEPSLGASGAESQTPLPSTGTLGITLSGLASENGSLDSAKRLQPAPSEEANPLDIYSSVTGMDTYMAPSAAESQPASSPSDGVKATGSLSSASEGSPLSPDVDGFGAGEGIAVVSENRPSLSVFPADSREASLPNEGVEASDPGPAGSMGSAGSGASKGVAELKDSSASSPLAGETQSSEIALGDEASGGLGKGRPLLSSQGVETSTLEPMVIKGNQYSSDGSTTAAEKKPGDSSSVSDMEASLAPPAPGPQSASPSIEGSEDATSEAATDGESLPSPDGSTTEAEKPPGDSSSESEIEASLAPPASESQSASPSIEGADGATSEAADESVLSPDGSAMAAEKPPGDSSSVNEMEASLAPPAPGPQSDSSSTEVPEDATSEAATDGESLPSPNGSATTAEKLPGNSSSEMQVSLAPPASESQSASSSIERSENATSEAATDGESLPSPDGSATAAEKPPGDSSSVNEMESSLAPPAPGPQSDSSSTEVPEDATSEAATDGESLPSPNGSATEAEKPPGDSSSESEIEASLAPPASESQSASPSIEGAEDATSEAATDGESLPSPNGSATVAEKPPGDSSSVNEMESSLAPPAPGPQSDSSSTEVPEDATSEAATDGESLPSPDGFATAAEKPPGDSSSVNEMEASLAPPAPGPQSDSSSTEVPEDAISEAATDGESLPSPNGSATEAEKPPGNSSSESEIEASLAPPASESQSASPSIEGAEDATSEAATDGESLPSPNGSATVAEKPPGDSSSVNEMESSLAPPAPGPQSDSSSTEVPEDATSEAATDGESLPSPDGSATAAEKPPGGSSSVNEMEASLAPPASESQSASPSIEGADGATSEAADESVLSPDGSAMAAEKPPGDSSSVNEMESSLAPPAPGPQSDSSSTEVPEDATSEAATDGESLPSPNGSATVAEKPPGDSSSVNEMESSLAPPAPGPQSDSSSTEVPEDATSEAATDGESLPSPDGSATAAEKPPGDSSSVNEMEASLAPPASESQSASPSIEGADGATSEAADESVLSPDGSAMAAEKPPGDSSSVNEMEASLAPPAPGPQSDSSSTEVPEDAISEAATDGESLPSPDGSATVAEKPPGDSSSVNEMESSLAPPAPGPQSDSSSTEVPEDATSEAATDGESLPSPNGSATEAEKPPGDSSSESEIEASLAPPASESQSASPSIEGAEDATSEAATDGESLPSPDGSATVAEKPPGDSSSVNEMESSLAPPAPGPQSDSSSTEVPEDATSEAATDGESLPSPDGSTTAAEKPPGDSSSESEIEASLAPPASESQSASPSIEGADGATSEAADESVLSPDGSTMAAEKPPGDSSSVNEMESSLALPAPGPQSDSSSTEVPEDATSEAATDGESLPSPDGSATAAEKPPGDSSSVNEMEASLAPPAPGSQSASPPTEVPEDATSEAATDGEPLPSSHSPSTGGALASEMGKDPENISSMSWNKASLAPPATDSDSSVAENVAEEVREKPGSTAGEESFPQPSSVDESMALSPKSSGGAVASGSSSLKGSLATQGSLQQGSDITNSSQLPSGSENISDKGTSPESAGSGQPVTKSTGVAASKPASGLSSQTAGSISDGTEMSKIDSFSSYSGSRPAGPSPSGLAIPSNELVAPSRKSEGRGDADILGSTVDKDSSAASGEEVRLPVPGAPLSPFKTVSPRPVGETEPESKAETLPPSSKDEVTRTGDKPTLPEESSASSSNVASGLGTAKSGSLAGSRVSLPSDPAAKTKPAAGMSKDSSGRTKASPSDKSGAKSTASGLGPGPMKSSQATGKKSEKKEDQEKPGKKQESRKTEKKKENKSSEEESDLNSKNKEAKKANKNSEDQRRMSAISAPGPSDVRGPGLYKPGSWMQMNYRQKCLNWLSHEQQPLAWNQHLPPCPCSLQQGLSDRRYTRSQKGLLDSRFTMLYSSKPNERGAGVRCLYHKNNNQLVEGHQERVWRSWRKSSPDADGELKLYDWCCNQAGNQKFCDKYNQKRPKISCDGYRPSVQG